MTRLPQPGADNGAWGGILNDYLSQSHNTDGTLKDNVVGAGQLQNGTVTNAHVSSSAAIAVTKISGLGDAATKNVGTATGTVATGNDSRFAPFFTPEMYGAASTYSAAVNDTTFVQSAVAAAQTANGIVRLNRVYNTTTITITAPVKIEGSGGLTKFAAVQISGLSVDSTTADGLVVRASGVVLRDFAIVNRSSTTPTAGAGLKFDTDTVQTWGDLCRIDHVDTAWWYTNVRIAAGSMWTYQNSYNYGAAYRGLWVSNINNPDGGDQLISGVVLVAARTANEAIFWESGGGIKFVGNKTVSGAGGSWLHGLRLQPTSGTTSIAIIGNNSFESPRSSVIRYDDNGQTFGKLIITGNQCMIYTTSLTFNGVVEINGGGNLFDIVIGENTITGPTPNVSYGIYLDNVIRGSIGKNATPGISGLYLSSTCGVIDVIPPQVNGTAKVIVDERAGSNSAHIGMGTILHTYSRQIETTGKATPITTWGVGMATTSVCLVTFTANGNVSAGGVFFIQAKRMLTRGSSGNVSVATVGTDVTSGSAAGEILLATDVTVQTGDCFFTLQLSSGSASSDIYGKAGMIIDGSPRIVKRGLA